MIPASYIKKSIDFNARFRSLLEVLKLIAVAQYYALERKFRGFELFPEILAQFFNSIDLRDIKHPFLNSAGVTGIIAVTSDTGLAGGMNTQIMTKAMELVRSNSGNELVIVGEKGQSYAQDAGIPFTSFPGVIDAERYAQAVVLRDHVIRKVLTEKWGGCKVVFFRAVSFVIQRVEVVPLLPYEQEAGQSQGPSGFADLSTVILESTPTSILEYLIFMSLGQRFFEILGMSRLAEQAARFNHLEESCQKIADMNKKLLLQYFRRRHEMIDQNMRELFASRSIYAK